MAQHECVRIGVDAVITLLTKKVADDKIGTPLKDVDGYNHHKQLPFQGALMALSTQTRKLYYRSNL